MTVVDEAALLVGEDDGPLDFVLLLVICGVDGGRGQWRAQQERVVDRELKGG